MRAASAHAGTHVRTADNVDRTGTSQHGPQPANDHASCAAYTVYVAPPARAVVCVCVWGGGGVFVEVCERKRMTHWPQHGVESACHVGGHVHVCEWLGGCARVSIYTLRVVTADASEHRTDLGTAGNSVRRLVERAVDCRESKDIVRDETTREPPSCATS
jgi:hypothetical protein